LNGVTDDDHRLIGEIAPAFHVEDARVREGDPCGRRLVRVRRGDLLVVLAIHLGLLLQERLDDALPPFRHDRAPRAHDAEPALVFVEPHVHGGEIEPGDRVPQELLLFAVRLHGGLDRLLDTRRARWQKGHRASGVEKRLGQPPQGVRKIADGDEERGPFDLLGAVFFVTLPTRPPALARKRLRDGRPHLVMTTRFERREGAVGGETHGSVGVRPAAILEDVERDGDRSIRRDRRHARS
jgi:hypothetical protein